MEFQKFPGNPNGNLDSRESREFPGFPEWEFSVALFVHRAIHFLWFMLTCPSPRGFTCPWFGGSFVRRFTCPGFTCPGFTCPEVHLSGCSLLCTSRSRQL